MSALDGDLLAVSLSFLSARELLRVGVLVSRTFRECIATAPHAWPTTLDVRGLQAPPADAQLRLPWRSVRSIRGADSGAWLSLLPSLAPSLEAVSLAGALLWDRELERLPAQTTALDLQSCRNITNQGVGIVAATLGNLTQLNLSNCRLITEACFRHLRGLPLRSLTVRRNASVTTAGIAVLAATCGASLTELDLANCYDVSDESLEPLAQHRVPLTALNLSGCNVSDQCFAHLQGLPIRRLDVSSCPGICDEGVAFLSELPLQSLNFASCRNLSNAGLQSLVRLQLIELNLIATDVSGAGMRHLSNMPLTSLKVSNWWSDSRYVDDEGLAHIARCPLRRLEIPNATVSAAGLSQLPSTLEHLRISRCLSVGDSALALLAGLRQLHDLDLSGCPRVTDAGLAHLRDLPLARIGLSGCPRVSAQGLRQLAPRVQVLRDEAEKKDESGSMDSADAAGSQQA
jgi:hypothetical protein